MTPVDPLSVPERIDFLLAYIESMRAKDDGPYGRYVYRRGETAPLVYCSTYAAMARDLVSDLDNLAPSERQEWIGYLNAHQCDDGLYRDPAFGLPDDLTDVPLRADAGWAGGIAGWGWWHMTNHVYTALRSLGAVAPKMLSLLEPFYSERTRLETWLDERDWNLSWSVGNEVLNLGTFLLYARDFHNEPRAGGLVVRMLDWLDANQDPATGYWGTDCASAVGKRQAMCGAYHEYILYAYERRSIPRIEQVVDATLSLQNPGGGFGCDGRSGACEDIDAAFIFLSAYYQRDYRRGDIEDAVAKILPAVFEHQNADGGFVYLRGKPYEYGVPRMSSDADQSCMFPTWFRFLSLAVIGQILRRSLVGHDHLNWRFGDCPYIQWGDPERVKEEPAR